MPPRKRQVARAIPPQPRRLTMAEVQRRDQAHTATLPVSRLREASAPERSRQDARPGPGARSGPRPTQAESVAQMMGLAARDGGITVPEARAITGRGTHACQGVLTALAGAGRLTKTKDGHSWRYRAVVADEGAG